MRTDRKGAKHLIDEDMLLTTRGKKAFEITSKHYGNRITKAIDALQQIFDDAKAMKAEAIRSDLFTRTFNPALLQERASKTSDRCAQASNLLSAAAHKLEGPRLATHAVKIRLDAFVRVKKSTDDMIAALPKEGRRYHTRGFRCR